MNWAELFSKEWVRLVGVLLIGITIGALFYPTKRIEEKLHKVHQEEMASLKEVHSRETKELTEKYDSAVAESKSVKAESERKISQLTEEVRTLRQRTSTQTYKLVKPDGTIEERTFTESEIDQSSRVVTQIQEEFKQKVESIENRYAVIHAERVTALKREFDSKESEYKKTIDELTKSRTVTVNEKRFGIEAGILTDKNYYGHATMDLWGPIFLGVHGELSSEKLNGNKMGAGIGMRF